MTNIYDSEFSYTQGSIPFECPEGSALDPACAQAALDRLNAEADRVRCVARRAYSTAIGDHGRGFEEIQQTLDDCLEAGDLFDTFWDCWTNAQDSESTIDLALKLVKEVIGASFGAGLRAARDQYLVDMAECCEKTNKHVCYLCEREVDYEEHHCFGCQKCICDACGETFPCGSHEPEDHREA